MLIGPVAAETEAAQRALEELYGLYPCVPPERAEVIIPLGAGVLALTPISAFRPRRWRGALLPHKARVRIDALEPDKRPVSAVADFTEVRDVMAVEVSENRDTAMTVLFDHDSNLEERVL